MWVLFSYFHSVYAAVIANDAAENQVVSHGLTS